MAWKRVLSPVLGASAEWATVMGFSLLCSRQGTGRASKASAGISGARLSAALSIQEALERNAPYMEPLPVQQPPQDHKILARHFAGQLASNLFRAGIFARLALLHCLLQLQTRPTFRDPWALLLRAQHEHRPRVFLKPVSKNAGETAHIS